jgi:hypothetical protein
LIALISNAHRAHPVFHCLGEAASNRRAFGSVRIAQKDQKSNQDKPDPRRGLRHFLEILHTGRQSPALLEYADVYVSAQGYPLFTMSIEGRA